MIRRMKNGFRIIKRAIRFMFKKPICMIPFIVAMLIDLGFLFYLNGILQHETFTKSELYQLSFLIVFVESMCIAIASLVVLELLEQHETNGKMRIGKALIDAIFKDLIRALPVILIWSMIQFILMIIDSIFSGGKNKRRGFLSISTLIRAITRGIRMAVMMILASVAWEQLPIIKSYKKGLNVFQDNFVEATSAVTISPLISYVCILPLILAVLVIDSLEITVGIWFSYAAVIYLTIVYSIGLLIEQIFVAELYLWYKAYENEVDIARMNNDYAPNSLKDIKRPSLLNDVPDMVFKNNLT